MRKLGIEAYSCDLQDCSGTNPEWHIKGDALIEAYSGKYDLMIAHPPCTFITNAGARWLYKNGEINKERHKNMQEGKEFFMKLWNAPIPQIVIENPIPMKIVGLPDYSQIIQPYYFGDEAQKTTCLWIKNLPMLESTNIVGKGEFKERTSKTGRKKRQALWIYDALTKGKTKSEIQKIRSKTFPGIAKAIAEQYGFY